MLENKYPLFKKNEILEKGMLDLLRDNPMEIINQLYDDYSDGILNGFDFSINWEEKKLVLNPGILKFDGKIFWEKDVREIPFPETEDHYIIKFRLKCYSEEKKYYKRNGEIITETGTAVNEDELELVRFIMREGAELRDNYEKFEDLNREYNTLQVINVRYSSKHKLGTLNPLITMFWGMEAAERENVNTEDIVFYTACLNGLVERNIITLYINRKLRIETREFTNMEMYEELNKILNGLGPRRTIGVRQIFRPDKIIVD